MKRSNTDMPSSQSSDGSPPRKVPRLDEATLSQEEHRAMNQDVLDSFEEVVADLTVEDIKPHALNLLSLIVIHSPGCNLDPRYEDFREASRLLRQDNGLLDELQEAWNQKSFAGIRGLEILRPPQTRPSNDTADDVPMKDQYQATVESWQTAYRPGAEAAFLETIGERFLHPVDKYAHHIAVVQSSGTGKSRMLLEVSRKVFGVILNFASDNMNGYPKPDRDVRDYLTRVETPEDVEERTTSFFSALFDCLSRNEKRIASPSDLADFLGYGDPTKAEQRRNFFKAVITEAEKMKATPMTPTRPKGGSPVLRFTSDGPRSLADVAGGLSILKDRNIRHPVKLILGFDEASERAVNQAGVTWNAYTAVRRALRSLRSLAIYSVFMSTTGSVRQPQPCPVDDQSNRVQKGLGFWPPFTLLGFDQLAGRLVDGASLDDVTKVGFMLGLGRPLFKTRYIYGSQQVKDGIVRFAILKLLSGPDTDASQIAPLAVRLPLTFNSMTAKGRDAEQLQVESHMRICLKIIPEVDAMYTVAPSEPILVEAASQIMQSNDKPESGNAVDILQKFMSNRFLSKGDRGELACMLLMLLAHDRACEALHAREGAGLMRYHIPLPVTMFLKNLFTQRHWATILEARTIEGGKTLEETFKDSWVHFTHFVKVTDHEVVNRKYLMRLMARGAAVLCADNHLGIDGIVPVCFKGKTLTLDNMTSVLIQVKNVADLADARSALFANMDPGHVGVFGKGPQGSYPPVIKLLLSVGTRKVSFTSSSVLPLRPSRAVKQPPAVSRDHFEFFAGGLSHETFAPIHAVQEPIWQTLVSRSCVEDIYVDPPTSVRDVVARGMNPATQSCSRHWDAFFPLH